MKTKANKKVAYPAITLKQMFDSKGPVTILGIFFKDGHDKRVFNVRECEKVNDSQEMLKLVVNFKKNGRLYTLFVKSNLFRLLHPVEEVLKGDEYTMDSMTDILLTERVEEVSQKLTHQTFAVFSDGTGLRKG